MSAIDIDEQQQMRALSRLAIAKSPQVLLKWTRVAWPLALAEPRPLKVRIDRDITAAIPPPPRYAGFDAWTKDRVGEIVGTALAAWTRTPRYLTSCVVGAVRIDLNGEPASQVTHEEHDFARRIEQEIRDHGGPLTWDRACGPLAKWQVPLARRLWKRLVENS
jgi:hypothetical protein